MHVVHCKAYVDFLHCSCDPGKPLKIQPFLKLPKPVPLNGREIVWLKTSKISKAAQQHHAWISCQHLQLPKKRTLWMAKSDVESGVWLNQSWARQGVNLTLLGRLNRPFGNHHRATTKSCAVQSVTWRASAPQPLGWSDSPASWTKPVHVDSWYGHMDQHSHVLSCTPYGRSFYML